MSDSPSKSAEPKPIAATGNERTSLRYAIAGIALLSGSLLAYQVLLTRVCALRLHFHFGFLIISNCLLGIGASGTVLALTEARWKASPREWVWRLSVAYVISLGFTWIFLLTFPVPDTLNFTGVGEFLQFSTFNLVAAAPFFVGGTAVGLLLSAHATQIHKVYASDLFGAGLGCLAVPPLLWWFGAGGTFLSVVILGLISVAVVAPARARKGSLVGALALGLACLAAIPSLERWAPVPGKGFLDLTDSLRATIARTSEFSRWSANSRIDVLPMPPTHRFMFGRGSRSLAMPLPDQKLILQDGSAGTLVSDMSRQPMGLAVLERTLYSASFNLRREQKPSVFIIGMGGGNDVWAAMQHGASKIKAIELNDGVVEVHRTVVPEFSKRLLEDPRVTIQVDEGRSALMREGARYDVVQMTGIDTWTSLTSGAYILAESYLYTVEAVRQMYDHLNDGGLLQITRMAAEMETLRLLVNIEAAVDQDRAKALAQSIVALETSDHLTTVILKKGRFDTSELAAMKSFADGNGIKIVYLPGQGSTNPVAQFLNGSDRQAFVDSFPRNITATYDDKPYFFNFTRWTKPLESVKFMRESTNVSQGNPAFILGQLAFSTLLATLFIVAPLLVFRRKKDPDEGEAPKKGLGSFFVFFASIGVGFIAIEVAIMQKLTLLLGIPLYSIVVTLFSLLIFTGLGSMLSARWLSSASPRQALWVPGGIAVYLLLFSLGSTPVIDIAITWPTPARMALAAALVAPLAFLLGMPFAFGVDRIREHAPRYVPWAWAVNGSATVVGSIATVVLSMNLGFTAVLFIATVVYVLGFLALTRAPAQA